MMNLVYPPPRPLSPKFYITIVSNFPWVLQSSQEKSKTIITQVFLREKMVHYGICESGE